MILLSYYVTLMKLVTRRKREAVPGKGLKFLSTYSLKNQLAY